MRRTIKGTKCHTVKAGSLKPGDWVMTDRGPSRLVAVEDLRLRPAESSVKTAPKVSIQPCTTISTENGAEITVSNSTPILTKEPRDGDYIVSVAVGQHVVTDVGNGPEWSKVVRVADAGRQSVVAINVGGLNFFAGKTADKRIATHNSGGMSKH